jgi:hypothetical protein
MGKIYEDDTDEEVANRSEESQAIANEAKGDTMLKAMRDEAAKPKAVAKPKVSTASVAKPSATPSMAKEEVKTEVVTKPTTSAGKDTYRDMSGKVQTKKSAAERDAEMAARRESAMSGLRSIGSSISDMFSKAKQNATKLWLVAI